MIPPRARKEGIIVKELADETLLYDTAADKLHSLNRVAGFVWRHCDGGTDAAAIAGLIRGQLGLSANEASVELALEQLARRGLLEGPLPASPPERLRQRRELLKLLTSALAVPVIATITAPDVMAQASPPPETPTTTTPPPTDTRIPDEEEEE